MKIIANQSLLDVAIQECGSILTCFDFALKNGISITDDLAAGNEIEVPDSSYKNTEALSYFKGKNQNIATSITNENYELIIPMEGIGEMIIEDTFIVQ